MPSNDRQMINSNVVFVDRDIPMNDAVQIMIDQRISSLLVTDDTDHVVGILTERDIVQKFTLLDVSDKLTRTVGTMMSRPVKFARLATLKKDVTTMHLEHKVRHFPILNGKDPTKENIVGIVSITDVARQAMLQDSPHNASKQKSQYNLIVVGVLASQRSITNTYIYLFKGMGFAAREVSDIHKFATSPDAKKQALIFDMDGFSDLQLHELIPVAVKSKCFLVITTSNVSLVTVFKKYIDRDHQEIATKPVDLGYLTWILNRKWHIQDPGVSAA